MVAETIRSVKTVNEFAQEYGVHPTQVGQWKRELQEQAAGLFGARRGVRAAEPPASLDRITYIRPACGEDKYGKHKAADTESKTETRQHCSAASDGLPP